VALATSPQTLKVTRMATVRPSLQLLVLLVRAMIRLNNILILIILLIIIIRRTVITILMKNLLPFSLEEVLLATEITIKAARPVGLEVPMSRVALVDLDRDVVEKVEEGVEEQKAKVDVEDVEGIVVLGRLLSSVDVTNRDRILRHGLLGLVGMENNAVILKLVAFLMFLSLRKKLLCFPTINSRSLFSPHRILESCALSSLTSLELSRTLTLLSSFCLFVVSLTIVCLISPTPSTHSHFSFSCCIYHFRNIVYI